jgi:hypothetical protein
MFIIDKVKQIYVEEKGGDFMLEIVYLILGIVIIGFTLIDIIWTTLWVNGRVGPLTGPVSRNLWQFIRYISNANSFWMSLTGPLILVITLLMWIGLLWVGWTLIFSADPTSISDTLHGGQINWVERFYFIGYSLFTLGNGNYAPKEGIWQIISVLVSGVGMLFLTFGVSYILNIINAVVQQRSFATDITGIANSPEELLENGWNGEDFSRLNRLFISISNNLSSLTQQHKAYPLLFYYHSIDTEEAMANGMAILDETITILRYGIDREIDVNPIFIRSIRASITSYIKNAETVYNISMHEEGLPHPNLEKIEEMGVPMVDNEEYTMRVEELEERRRLLAGLLHANGRTVTED